MVGIDIDSWIGLSITMWTRLFLIGIVSEQVRKSRSHFEKIKKIGSEALRSRRDQGISLVHDSKQVSQNVKKSHMLVTCFRNPP